LNEFDEESHDEHVEWSVEDQDNDSENDEEAEAFCRAEDSDLEAMNAQQVRWTSQVEAGEVAKRATVGNQRNTENASGKTDNSEGLGKLSQEKQKVVYVPDLNDYSAISVHNFIELQQQDSKLRKWSNKAKTNTHPKFLFENNMLKVITKDFGTLIVVPEKLEKHLILQAHQGVFNFAHLGVASTIRKVLEKYYIKGLANKVRDVIKSCSTCQRLKRSYDNNDVPMLRQPLVIQPFIKVAIDFIGPLKTSSTGNKYILNCIDLHSRYSVLIPTPDQKAHTFMKTFKKEWMKHFGVPDILLSDNGPCFIAKVSQTFCKLYGMKKQFTLPYRPQSNGVVERTNQTVMQQLRTATSSRNMQFWDQKLDTIMLNMNNVIHSSTGYKPSQLIFGIEVKLPYRLLIEDDGNDKQPRTLTDFTAEWYQDLKRIRTENVKRQIAQQESYISSQQEVDQANPFRAGQLVSVSRIPEHKLQSKWVGPYTITGIQGNTAIIRARNVPAALSRAVHFEKLKHYHITTVDESGDDVPVEDPSYPVADLIDQDYNMDQDREAELEVGEVGFEDIEDADELKEHEFGVYKILNKRIRRGKIQYLIHWDNYEQDDSTWEPMENLDNSKDLIEEYEKEQNTKRLKSSGHRDRIQLIL
jgi:hypothetical protein